MYITDNEYFDPIGYWSDGYFSQPDLAQFALDILAVSPVSDECERPFSRAKPWGVATFWQGRACAFLLLSVAPASRWMLLKLTSVYGHGTSALKRVRLT
jgi:hypothetical protein